MKTQLKFAVFGLLSAVIIQQCALGQGSLTPPGAPAPTMKTLQQVEPRTPISSAPFTISQPGSYYLTTNLTGSVEQSGIIIAASDVTLDLNGFTLAGVPGSSNGVEVASSVTNLAIRNGVIRGWGRRGVNAELCDGGLFERLRVLDNGNWGLATGQRSIVKDCTAINNHGRGIAVDYHSVVTGCLCAGTDGDGFFSPNGVTMRDCLAMNNSGSGFLPAGVSALTGCTSRDNGGDGFAVADGSSISACTATANGGSGIRAHLCSVVKDCAVKNNGNGGIVATDNCTISGCTARQNYGPAGIQVQTGCLVLNNACFEHDGGESDIPGIRALGNGNRIEGNNVCNNGWGIAIEGTGNFIFRNTASGNISGNYTNTPGNVVGEIIDVSGGATITSASPWANFSY